MTSHHHLNYADEPSTLEHTALNRSLAETFRRRLTAHIDAWDRSSLNVVAVEQRAPRGDGRVLVLSLEGGGTLASLVGPGCFLSAVTGEASLGDWRLAFWPPGLPDEAISGHALDIEHLELTEAISIAAFAGVVGDRWMLDQLTRIEQVLAAYAQSDDSYASSAGQYARAKALVARRLRATTNANA